MHRNLSIYNRCTCVAAAYCQFTLHVPAHHVRFYNILHHAPVHIWGWNPSTIMVAHMHSVWTQLLTAHLLCLSHGWYLFWCAVTLVCVCVDALGVKWGWILFNKPIRSRSPSPCVFRANPEQLLIKHLVERYREVGNTARPVANYTGQCNVSTFTAKGVFTQALLASKRLTSTSIFYCWCQNMGTLEDVKKMVQSIPDVNPHDVKNFDARQPLTTSTFWRCVANVKTPFGPPEILVWKSGSETTKFLKLFDSLFPKFWPKSCLWMERDDTHEVPEPSVVGLPWNPHPPRTPPPPPRNAHIVQCSQVSKKKQNKMEVEVPKVIVNPFLRTFTKRP